MVRKTFKVSVPHAKYRHGGGLDIHLEYVTAGVVVERPEGINKQALQEFKQSPAGLRDMCHFLGKYPLETIVMEATGAYTPPVKAALEAYGGWGMIHPRIIVINPSLIRKFPGESHTDKASAIELAELGLRGLARASFLPSGKVREVRALTREIEFQERDCTRAKNRAKRVLAAWGLPLAKLNLDAKWALYLLRALDEAGGDFGKALDAIASGTCRVSPHTRRALSRREVNFAAFRPVHLPSTACTVLRSHLASLAFHQLVAGQLGHLVGDMVAESQAGLAAVLQISEVPGISEEGAAAIIAEVGDINRFAKGRKFLGYAGCASAQYDSGKTHIAGHLSKRVNHFLKRRFFMAGKNVCTIVKEDSDLKEYARAQMNAHWEDKKLAYMNTGIRIAGIVYTLLKTGRKYDPFYASQREGKEHGANQEEIKPGNQDTLPNAPSKAQAALFRILRNRTRRFARYVVDVLGGASAGWYEALGQYFSLLSEGSIQLQPRSSPSRKAGGRSQ